jgi:hypothetical protein
MFLDLNDGSTVLLHGIGRIGPVQHAGIREVFDLAGGLLGETHQEQVEFMKRDALARAHPHGEVCTLAEPLRFLADQLEADASVTRPAA